MAGEMLWSTQSGYLTNNKLNKTFQKAAQPLMRFRQFVKFKESFGKSQGESVNWLKVANVSTYGGSLVETDTMHETKQVLTWGTLTVDEYGVLCAVVKSGEFRETPNVKARTILSQVQREISEKVQRLLDEAKSFLGYANNSYTSARPKMRSGRYSLSCMETCRTMA